MNAERSCRWPRAATVRSPDLMIADLRSHGLVVASATFAAALLGALSAVRPMIALGLVALVIVGLLPFKFPVGHFVLLLFVLGALPFGLQNRFGFGGGTGAVGVVLSDLLLAGGLLRAMIVLGRQRITALQVAAVFLMTLFMAVVIAQLVHGVLRGGLLSEVGTEARVMLGYSALLIALPILNDERQRRALLRGLVVLGLVLGGTGLAQWLFGISYGSTDDFGVREGVQLTSAGRGQLQGGLNGFPVVVIMGVAALAAHTAATLRGRVILGVMVGLNIICLLLTFERTFWLVTVVGCALVVVRAGHARRRILVWAPILAALVFVSVASVSPTTLTTGRERLLSLGQYSSDGSVYYRLVESGHVLTQIRARPLAGSGLGASIYWGRPLYRVPPERYTFIHNGFLYVAWKLGVITAALLLLGFLAAIARSRRAFDPAIALIVAGAQGSLLALLLASLTFPTVAALSSTAMIGLLLAICLVRPAMREGDSTSDAASGSRGRVAGWAIAAQLRR